VGLINAFHVTTRQHASLRQTIVTQLAHLILLQTYNSQKAKKGLTMSLQLQCARK